MIKSNPNAFLVKDEEYNVIPNGGNRDKIQAHVNNIKRAILAGSKMPPILVDINTKQIIDGQHRYWAFKTIWAEGHEIFMPVIMEHYDNPILAAIEFNNTSVKWPPEVYVKAYIADGRESYKKLYDFVMSHPLFFNEGRPQWKAACKIFGYSGTTAIKNGNFYIESTDKAEEIYRELEVLAPYGFMENDHISAWLSKREAVLRFYDMSYIKQRLASKFIRPTNDVTGEWIMALSNILE